MCVHFRLAKTPKRKRLKEQRESMHANGIKRKLATGEYTVTGKEGRAAVWGGKRK